MSSLREVRERAPKGATVVDVSARDGLQALPTALSVAQRARWVRSLLDAGVPEVEAASFVAPARVPQMSGAAELLGELSDVIDRVWVLVPNRRGAERALGAGARNLVCVLSATERHSVENLGRPIDAVVAEWVGTMAILNRTQVRTRAAISMAWGDADERPAARLFGLCRRLRGLGFEELTLCDTDGRASPFAVAELVESLGPLYPPTALGLHLHDALGLAAAGALAGLLAGVSRFDGSLGGLGGCPFVAGARGNLDTEVLVRLLEGAGARTGISAEALAAARRSCLGALA